MPPEIISASLDDGETLELAFHQSYMFVIAEDPDGDEFVCNWFIPGEAPFGHGEPFQGSGDSGEEVLHGCGLWLYPDADYANFQSYDGRVLTCQVYDLPERSLAERSWPITFSGGGS